jgi:hypothetical protein
MCAHSWKRYGDSTRANSNFASPSQTERTRRQAEIDAQDARDMANQLQQQNAGLLANKRKIEAECAAMHVGYNSGRF